MDCLIGSCFITFLNRDNINMIDNNVHVPFHMGTKILILCVFDSDPHHCSRAPCKAQSLEYVDRAHWDPAVPSASSASSSSPSHMSRSCMQTTETSWSRYMSLECHLTKQKRKRSGRMKSLIIRQFLSVSIMEYHKESAHKTEKSLLGYFFLLLFQINISEIKWRAKSNFCFKKMPKNVLKEIYFNMNSFTLNSSKTILSDITANHNELCFNICCCW